VLRQICQLIAADEYRHFKLFYDHMRAISDGEDLLPPPAAHCRRRITESEDEQLAFAYHCGNDRSARVQPRALHRSLYGKAMSMYRFRHIERAMGWC